jgi:hypothetical protein
MKTRRQAVKEHAMQTIRICRKLESITPHLPELSPLVGKTVEFIVREESAEFGPADGTATQWVNPLRGSVLRDDDPFGPAVDPEEWEVNR